MLFYFKIYASEQLKARGINDIKEFVSLSLFGSVISKDGGLGERVEACVCVWWELDEDIKNQISMKIYFLSTIQHI